LKPIELNEIPLEIKSFLATIDSIKFPRQGYTSDVIILEANEEKYVLKRTKGEFNCSLLKKENSNLDILVRQTKISVPKVHIFAEKKTSESWLLMECLQGETIRSALFNEKSKEKREEILFNFGRCLSEIHHTYCPPALKHETNWLNQMLYQAEYNFKNFQVDGDQKLLEKIITHPLHIERQTLIHGDLTIDNVLVQNGIISGIIDWGNATYGDPRFDLALAIRPKPNAFQDEKDKLVFFEGYGENVIENHIYNYYANGLYEFF